MARRSFRTRGGRWLVLVAVLGTVAGVGWPLLATTGEGSAGPDPVRITDYRAAFTVSADGTLAAVERVRAEFPAGRHGIFRFWDVADPADDRVRLNPRDIAVQLDGGDVPVDLSWQGPHRYRVARIGDPDTTLAPGSHTYVLRYTVDGALAAPGAGEGFADAGTPGSARSAFFWNVLPGGWDMTIARSRITVRLPSAPEGAAVCRAGRDATYPCSVGVTGRTVRVTTGALPPRTPVTVRAALDTAAPDRVTLPWPVRLDAVLGRSVALVVVLVALSAVALAAGAAWARRAREPDPGFPVMYAPPDGFGPVQTVFVATESVPGPALVSSLLHLAERGVVRLRQEGPKEWTVEGTGAASKVDTVSRSVAEALGVARAGGSFAADGSVAAGRRLQEATSRLQDRCRRWAREAGLVEPAPRERLGQVVVCAAALVAAAVFVAHPFDVTLLGLPAAAFAVGGAPLVRTGVGTRRTPAGRDAWARAGGFHRLLATPSAEDRFDVSARRDLYTAYVPYAVAFGCADAWARRYEVATGEPAPTPVWYAGTAGFSGGSTPLASFQSSLSASIGAYAASQSSSSSGGGAGGGGGGGGGGSW